MNQPMSWERKVDSWVVTSIPWAGKVIRPVNWLLADEKLIFLLWLPVLVFLSPDSLFASLCVLSILCSPSLEQGLKRVFNRGRPDDPTELGCPSGDCVLAALLWALVLGPWGLILAFVVAAARVLQRRHWVLDTVIGLGLGFWLSSLVYSVYLLGSYLPSF